MRHLCGILLASVAATLALASPNACAGSDTNFHPFSVSGSNVTYTDAQGRTWFVSSYEDKTYDYWASLYNPVTGFAYGTGDWKGVRWASNAEVYQLFGEISATAQPVNGNFQMMEDLGFTEGFHPGPGTFYVLAGLTRDQYITYDGITVQSITPSSYDISDPIFTSAPIPWPSTYRDTSVSAWFYYAPPYLAPEPGALALFAAGLAGIAVGLRRRRVRRAS